DAGLTEPEVFEVPLLTAYFNYTNRVGEGLGVEPEQPSDHVRRPSTPHEPPRVRAPRVTRESAAGVPGTVPGTPAVIKRSRLAHGSSRGGDAGRCRDVPIERVTAGGG